MSEEKQVVIGPCSYKQKLVLCENEVDILLTGGGAGGGKTQMALTKALSFVQDPNARVVIARASYPILKMSGGIVDTAKALYRQFDSEYKIQPMEFHFQNGATIKIMAVPENLEDLKGGQFTHVIIDECTETTLEAVLMYQSRVRSATYKGPKMGMMLTCNPDRNSWLYPWVEWCLDEYGVPKKGTENITRWFVNINNKVHFGNSVEELYEEYGKGRVLGKSFIPLSFKFIPMTLDDNPVLDKAMPEYRANLLSGKRVAQLRFLHGSWTAVPEGSSVFNREWIKIVDAPPVNPVQKIRSWDLAHSKPSETYPDPDYTAGVLMSRTAYGTYCIEDVVRFRELTDTVVKNIIDTAKDTDGLDIQVTIPKDNGGGKAASQFFLRIFAENMLNVRGIPINNQSSKMQRFLPFCTLAESGVVTMVKGDWNEDWLTELEQFTGERKNHDDQVDATSDAFNTIARQTIMPSIYVPNMTNPSPIPSIN